MTKYKVPKWAKEVRKSMIDIDMNVKEMAQCVGRSRELVNRVLTGSMMNETLQKDIIAVIQKKTGRKI